MDAQRKYIEYIIQGFNESFYNLLFKPGSTQITWMLDNNEITLLKKFYLFLESNGILNKYIPQIK